MVALEHVHLLTAGTIYVDHDLVLKVLPTVDCGILLGVYTVVHILLVRSKGLRYDVARFVSA